MRQLLVIIFLMPVLLCSCKSNGFLMAKAKVNLYGNTYPSKEENANIDIYRTQKPDFEYEEIGEITCADTDEEWALKQTLIKAREIGADGIIILGNAGAYGVGIPVGETMVYSGSEGYGIKAIAIKYKAEKTLND